MEEPWEAYKEIVGETIAAVGGAKEKKKRTTLGGLMSIGKWYDVILIVFDLYCICICFVKWLVHD